RRTQLPLCLPHTLRVYPSQYHADTRERCEVLSREVRQQDCLNRSLTEWRDRRRPRGRRDWPREGCEGRITRQRGYFHARPDLHPFDKASLWSPERGRRNQVLHLPSADLPPHRDSPLAP